MGREGGAQGAVFTRARACVFMCTRAGSADFTAKLWNAMTGEETATLEHSHVVKSVDFDASGARLATGGQDKKLRVWALDAHASPHSSAATTVTLPDKVRKVLWSPDRRTVLVGCEDGTIRMVDVATGSVVRERNVGAAAVCDLELSAPNGQRTLTVAAGSAVHFLDPDTLDVRRSHTLPAPVESASLHPVHGRVFVAGHDVHVYVADEERGSELSVQKGHHGLVHCVRFAPDGCTFASGADDATIRLWRTEDSVPAENGASAKSHAP